MLVIQSLLGLGTPASNAMRGSKTSLWPSCSTGFGYLQHINCSRLLEYAGASPTHVLAEGDLGPVRRQPGRLQGTHVLRSDMIIPVSCGLTLAHVVNGITPLGAWIGLTVG